MGNGALAIGPKLPRPSSTLPSLWVAAHHRAATTATPRRPYGAGGGEDCRPWSRSRLSMRAPLPTTDALFAQEVEQKMSNLLAGFGAVQSFLDRTKHRTATQLAAAETSPGTSKFESNLPGWEDSNFDVTQADRLGRGSQCGRDGDCGQETIQPNREDHSPLGPQPSPPRRLNPKPRDVPKR